MKPNYGDRRGPLVYVRDALDIFPDGGYWIDINTGIISQGRLNPNTEAVAKAIERATIPYEDRPDIVDLIRYVRPYVGYANDSTVDPLDIDNMQGTTFAIRLDYKMRVIHFAYASCNGDNFSKTIGKQIACDRFDKGPEGGHLHTIPMLAGRISDFGTLSAGRISDFGTLSDIYRNGRKFLTPVAIRHFEMAGF